MDDALCFLVETPINDVEQCFSYCKELLLCHSVRVCKTIRVSI